MNPRTTRAGVVAGPGLTFVCVVVVAGASGPWAPVTDQARQDWC